MVKKIKPGTVNDNFDSAFDKLDSDLDFSSEFSFDEKLDSDKPITKILKGTKDSILEQFKSVKILKEKIGKKLLPKGFGDTLDLIETASNSVKELSSDIKKEVAPSIKEIKKSLPNLIPSDSKYLPKNVKEILDGWKKESNEINKTLTEENVRETMVDETIKSIFKIQEVNRLNDKNEDNANKQIDRVINLRHHKDSVFLLNSQTSHLNELVRYHYDIDLKFKKKSLELQYKQFFLLKDSIQFAIDDKKKKDSYFDALIHNTALSDSAKIKKEKTNDGDSNLFGTNSSFINNLTKKFKSEISEKTKSLFEAVSANLSQIEMAKSMSEGVDKDYLKGNIIGNFISDFGTDFIANKYKDKLLNSKFSKKIGLKEKGLKLESFNENLPNLLNEFKKKDYGFDSSVKGSLLSLLQGIVPDMSVDKNFKISNNASVLEPFNFTKQTDISINQVIPGFLSKILREIQITRTGNENLEELKFDYNSNSFKNFKSISNSIGKTVFSKSFLDNTSRQLDSIISDVENKSGIKLSDKSKSILRKQLLESSTNKELANEKNLSNFENKNINDKNKTEIQNLLKKYFNNINPEEKLEFDKKYNLLSDSIPNQKELIQNYINTGNIDELRKLKLLDKDNRLNIDTILNKYSNYKPSNEKDVIKENIFSKSVNNLYNIGKNKLTDIKNQINDIYVNSEAKPRITKTLLELGKYKDRVTNKVITKIEDIKNDVIDENGNIVLNKDDIKQMFTFDNITKQYKKITINNNSIDTLKTKFNSFSKDDTIKKLNEIINQTKDNLKTVKDVYVKGRPDPALYAEKLKAGLYRLRNSGKVIKDPKEIDDDVIDENGNIVVAKQDATNLVVYETRLRRFETIRTLLTPFTALLKGAWWYQTKVAPKWSMFNLKVLGKTTKFAYNMIVTGFVKDVYVGNESSPRLYAAKIKNGDYFIRRTGKVITHHNQVTEEIIDGDGNIVISYDELPELRVYTSALKWLNPFKLLATGGKLLAKGIIGTQKLAFKFAKFNLNILTKTTKYVAKGLVKFFTETVDVYIKGETKPILLKKDFKAGKYISAKTGKVITHHSEIDGAVLDEDGNTILTEEEYATGIYDYTGKILKGKVVSKFLKGMFSLLNKPFRYKTKLLKVKDLPKNAKDAEKKGLNKTEYASLKTASTLDEIKTILNNKFNKKKLFGDTDDDGDVENSLLDKLKRKKARDNINPKATVKGKIEDKKDKEEGFFSKLTSILGGTIGTFVTKGIELVGKFGTMFLGLLPKLANAMGSATSLLDKIPGVGKVGKFLKGPGGKILGSVAAVGLGAYEAYSGYKDAQEQLDAGKITKEQANELKGEAIGSGAGGAGGAIAGAAAGAALGSFVPIVGTAIGGLIGGALGYYGGSYAGGKIGKGIANYFTKKPDSTKKGLSLQMFRYVQYGFTRENTNYLERILGLETYLSQYVKVNNGNVIIEEDEIQIKKLASIFDLDPGNRSHLELLFDWYQFRFKPVYVRHMASINSITGKYDLDAVSGLDSKNLNTYIENTKYLEGPYSYNKLPILGVKIRVSNSTDVFNELKSLQSSLDISSSNKLTDIQAIKVSNTETFSKNNISTIDFKDNIKTTKVETIEKQKSLTGLSVSGESLVTTDNKLISALDSIKFKTYGLVELEETKVNALKYLENKVKPFITFKNNVAIFTGNPSEVLTSSFAMFNISLMDTLQCRSFSIWFTDRFLVTYLTYLTGIKTYLNKLPFEDNLANQLSIKDQNSLARKLISIPAWYVKNSPWKNYNINLNIGSTNNSINYLDNLNKKVVLEEQGNNVSVKENSINNISPTDELQKPLVNISKPKLTDQPDAEEEISGQKVSTEQLSTGSLKVAGGPLFDGRNASSFMSLGKGVDLRGLNPEMAKNLYGMIEEYGNITGKKVNINSAFRSIEEQERLYKKYGPGRAAKPGSSLHEYGLAVDINSDDLLEIEKLGLMRKYGFTRPVGGESWHVEPIGIQTNLQKYKNDPVAAQLAVKAGLGKGGGGMGIIANAPKYSRNLDLVNNIMNSNATNIAFKTKDNSIYLASTPNVKQESKKENRLNLEQNNGFIKASFNPSAEDGFNKTDINFKNTFNDNISANSVNNNTSNNQGINEVVDPREATIKAARLVGVDEKLMLKVAAIESGLNPNAKSKSGTAGGLFQFVDDTWKYLLKKYGTKYGLDENTSKFNVKANALMAAHYIKDAIKVLGKNANASSIYLSHFLGPTGAKTLLNNIDNNPNEIGAKVLPDAAKANKSIFYSKDGTARTVSEIYSLVTNKLDSKSKEFNLDNDSNVSNVFASNKSTDNVKIIKASYSPSDNKKEIVNIKTKSVNANIYNPTSDIKTDKTVPQAPINIDRSLFDDTNKILLNSLKVQENIFKKLNELVEIQKKSDENNQKNNNINNAQNNTDNVKPYDSVRPRVLLEKDSKYL